MTVWSRASQWHEMFGYDPDVMGSNPCWVELGGALYFCLSQTYTKKICLNM